MNNPKNPPPSKKFLDWLSAELSERMSEKLSLVKISPIQIFELEPRSGQGLKILHRMHPGSKLFSSPGSHYGFLDLLGNLFNKGVPKHRPVAKSSTEKFELANAQMDLFWASSWCFGHQDPWQEQIKEWRRLLKLDGLLMFSYLGPDTAKEFRNFPGCNSLLGVDMHDMGDVLVKSGFGDPVMDMEYVTLTYSNKDLFLNDAISLGIFGDHPKMADLLTFAESIKDMNGGWHLTLELVYGHAWAVNLRTPGIAMIKPEDIVLKAKQ